MKILEGIPVSTGIAIGPACIIERPKLNIERKRIHPDEVALEIRKFHKAITELGEEIDHLIADLSQPQDNRDILTTHKMILQDVEFAANISRLVKNELCGIEEAINRHFTNVVNLFNDMENEYFSLRSSDYEDVAYRLLSKLLNQKSNYFAKLSENSIMITKNITPSEVTRVFNKNIAGFCTEGGSKNSHSSIIARSMNLPTLVDIQDLLQMVNDKDLLIIDGNLGKLIINPDKKTQDHYQKLLAEEKTQLNYLQTLIGKKCVTTDGKVIKLMCNIEIPEEISNVVKLKSDGVGLFRTEFLFMDKNRLPSEDQQFEIYRDIVKQLSPDPVVFRTIDVGGDKLSGLLNIEHELNPNLGTRGIRISLKHIPIFKVQLRAILRASVFGNVKVMFPMISTVGEILRIKEILKECREELKTEKIPFKSDIKIGAMIEIPSAAITSDNLAQECDFLSIGTNDLVQYTLAVDRDNELVDEYYIPHHPSVLRLLKLTADNGYKYNVPVAICGEMASEEKYIPFLLGLGINEFSVSPGRLLMVKNTIMKCNYQKAVAKTNQILKENTYIDVMKRIEEFRL